MSFTYQVALDEKLDLASWAADAVSRLDHTKLLCPPELSLFAFRVEPPGMDRARLDALNRDILAGVNRRGRVYLTGTTLSQGFVLRICVLSFRTHQDRMTLALEDLAAEIAAHVPA